MLEELVSVIIPARNEQEYIGRFSLPSVSEQSYRNLETLVVCNGCKDNGRTAEAARSFSERIPRLRVIETEKGGVSHARNLGARNAYGNVLVFLDADIRMSGNMIEEIMSKRKQAEHFIGVCKGYPDTDNFKAKAFFSIRELIFRRFSLCNGLLFSDKDTYDYVGGFSENKQRFEIKDFLNKGREFARDFYIDKAHTIVSMRRYEKGGYAREGMKWFDPTISEYKVIR